MSASNPRWVLDAPGLACISLTPLVKKTITEFEAGEVLEVRTDDPAAREGIPAWCRLTKNPLLVATEHDKRNTTFLIAAKPR